MINWDLIGTVDGPVIVHPPQRCAGQVCCVHNPSVHPLDSAPLVWRSDRVLMERRCEHGVGHPDPDDLAHKARTWGSNYARWNAIHDCCPDRCCCG